MSPHRKSGRVTPIKGSPIGKVRLHGREYSDKTIRNSSNVTDNFHEETKCFCGISFPEHTVEELSYIAEHKTCKRVARKA